MHLVGFFEVAGHFGKNFAIANAYIYSETKYITNLILNGVCNCNGIWIDFVGTGHIQKAFVDGVFLNHRSIFSADVHKGFGGFFVKSEVRSCQKQIRTFTKCHGHRLAGFNSELLGWNGFCEDYAGAFIPVAANS